MTALADGTLLRNGATYLFQVRSVNDLGAGEAGEEAESTPTPNTPFTFDTGGPITRITTMGDPAGKVGRVPAKLQAVLGGIDDGEEGVTFAQAEEADYTFQWQWIRVRGSVEIEIPGATSTTFLPPSTVSSDYTLTPADAGWRVKARLRFRDDSYNLEEWESADFPEYDGPAPIQPEATCAAPTFKADETRLWSEEIELVPVTSSAHYGAVPSAQFSSSGNNYDIVTLYQELEGTHAGRLVLFSTSYIDVTSSSLVLHVCDEAYAFASAGRTGGGGSYVYMWDARPGTDWTNLVERTLYVSRTPGGRRPCAWWSTATHRASTSPPQRWSSPSTSSCGPGGLPRACPPEPIQRAGERLVR